MVSDPCPEMTHGGAVDGLMRLDENLPKPSATCRAGKPRARGKQPLRGGGGILRRRQRAAGIRAPYRVRDPERPPRAVDFARAAALEETVEATAWIRRRGWL